MLLIHSLVQIIFSITDLLIWCYDFPW